MEHEQFTEPGADRPPTEEEEVAAEDARAGVDVERVKEHYDEMSDLGAHIRGEGEIDRSGED